MVFLTNMFFYLFLQLLFGPSPEVLVHKVRNHAMEVQTIVEARLRQVDEVRRSDGHPGAERSVN